MADSKEDLFLLAVGQKMGLGTTELATFLSKVTTNSAIRQIVLDVASGPDKPGAPAIDPKYDGFLKVLGDRFKADTGVPGFTNGFIDKLNADLKKDPALAERLKASISTNPAISANQLALYKHGELKPTVDTLDTLIRAAAAPAPAPAPAAPAPYATVSKPPPRPAPAPASAPVAAATPPRPAVAADTPAMPAVTTVPGAAAGASAQAPGAAPAPAPAGSAPQGQINIAEVRRQAAEQVMAAFASPSTSDETISESMNPDMVKALATTLGAYAKKNFPGSIGRDADKFVADVHASRDIQEKIAKNLAQNPQLVRSLAQGMGSNGGIDLNKPMVRSFVENTIKTIFGNPTKLADKSYTDGLHNNIKRANDGGDQMQRFLAGLGFDRQSMGNLGNMMEGMARQMMQGFGNLMNNNGHIMANGRGGGLFAPVDLLWKDSGHDHFYAKFATTLTRQGAKGPISDGSSVVLVEDGQGGQTEEKVYDPEKDHRIEIKTGEKSTAKVFLTSGLSPTRMSDGNYEWLLAVKVSHNGQPLPGDMRSFKLDPAESNRLYAELKKAGATNVIDPATILPFELTDVQKGLVTRVDPQRGHTSPDTVAPRTRLGVAPPGPERDLTPT